MFTKILNRIFDIAVSFVFLILFSPIFLTISLVIKLSDGGTIFADNCYRIGENGNLFFMYKFRSMINDAHNIIQTDPKYKEVKKKWLKEKLSIKEDKRITKIGTILRRLDVDELAQFINVIKGDMSIVGPRPFFPEEFENVVRSNKKYKKMFKTISKVKPGITGMWQVNGRNKLNIQQRMHIDYNYALHKNIFMDIVIILKTPIVIFLHILNGDN